MAVIETMTFRLRDGADEDAFLAADAQLQCDFGYQQPGLLRRTTARGDGDRTGEWLVIDLWDSAADADACALRWESDPVVQRFLAFVDRASIDVRRYNDLG